MTQIKELVAALQETAPNPSFKLRQGKIVSVQDSTNCTITIAGSTTQIDGVRYDSSVCPIPNATCWLATDGQDWFVLSTLAPNGPAYASMRQSSAQSIPTGAFTALNWTNRTETTATGMTLGNSGITCVVPGLYTVSVAVTFTANATGQRHLIITHNGTNEVQGYSTDAPTGSDVCRMSITTTLPLAIGDTVNANAFQSSGGALNTTVGTGHTILRAVWIGPSS